MDRNRLLLAAALAGGTGLPANAMMTGSAAPSAGVLAVIAAATVGAAFIRRIIRLIATAVALALGLVAVYLVATGKMQSFL